MVAAARRRSPLEKRPAILRDRGASFFRRERLPPADDVEVAEGAGVRIGALAERDGRVVELSERLADKLLEACGVVRIGGSPEAEFAVYELRRIVRRFIART